MLEARDEPGEVVLEDEDHQSLHKLRGVLRVVPPERQNPCDVVLEDCPPSGPPVSEIPGSGQTAVQAITVTVPVIEVTVHPEYGVECCWVAGPQLLDDPSGIHEPVEGLSRLHERYIVPNQILVAGDSSPDEVKPGLNAGGHRLLQHEKLLYGSDKASVVEGSVHLTEADQVNPGDPDIDGVRSVHKEICRTKQATKAQTGLVQAPKALIQAAQDNQCVISADGGSSTSAELPGTLTSSVSTEFWAYARMLTLGT